jgi:hypothetical protein
VLILLLVGGLLTVLMMVWYFRTIGRIQVKWRLPKSPRPAGLREANPDLPGGRADDAQGARGAAAGEGRGRPTG